MIGWLKGKKIDTWNTVKKTGVLIACCGIGYEVQLLPRDKDKNKNIDEITLWIHQIFKEDCVFLFGFNEKQERDLFRKLIAVNGIGPQTAVSLLETYLFEELVEAIRDSDISKLTKASGIGKRTAERLTIELKGKLDFFDFKDEFEEDNSKSYYQMDSKLNLDLKSELCTILEDLHYEKLEINQAIKAISEEINQETLPTKLETETQSKAIQELYLKKALVWLSQDLASKGT